MNLILQNLTFKYYMELNDNSEINRIFCKHGLQHAFDVARICYIMNLERDLKIEKDIIYAAALLHDIGKWQQYTNKVPHNLLSAEYAVSILSECSYNQNEIDMIVKAIENHRKACAEDDSLTYLLYLADKKSRACFNCDALQECNWREDKRNKMLEY